MGTALFPHNWFSISIYLYESVTKYIAYKLFVLIYDQYPALFIVLKINFRHQTYKQYVFSLFHSFILRLHPIHKYSSFNAVQKIFSYYQKSTLFVF